MTYQRVNKSSSSKPETQAKTEPSRFAPRTFQVQPQLESVNSASKQNLQETKEKTGNNTPEAQENINHYSANTAIFSRPSFFAPRPPATTPRVQMKLNVTLGIKRVF